MFRAVQLVPISERILVLLTIAYIVDADVSDLLYLIGFYAMLYKYFLIKS
jgi:hypothetical protein